MPNTNNPVLNKPIYAETSGYNDKIIQAMDQWERNVYANTLPTTRGPRGTQYANSPWNTLGIKYPNMLSGGFGIPSTESDLRYKQNVLNTNYFNFLMKLFPEFFKPKTSTQTIDMPPSGILMKDFSKEPTTG